MFTLPAYTMTSWTIMKAATAGWTLNPSHSKPTRPEGVSTGLAETRAMTTAAYKTDVVRVPARVCVGPEPPALHDARGR